MVHVIPVRLGFFGFFYDPVSAECEEKGGEVTVSLVSSI